MKRTFITKTGSTVFIEVDETGHEVTVEDDAGCTVGAMQFRAITVPISPYEEIEQWHLCHMDMGARRGEGIGRRCLELIKEQVGVAITASEDDGIQKDDGSHLVGDGPGFVDKMREERLIAGRSSREPEEDFED